MEDSFDYVVNHVFMPPDLPWADDQRPENNRALCDLVLGIARDYVQNPEEGEVEPWKPILRMLENLLALHGEYGFGTEYKRVIGSMRIGDIFTALIKAQNAGIIFRKNHDGVLFESFEVSAPAAEVMKGTRKLLWSFPGPAVVIPLEAFGNEVFLRELSSYLVQMNENVMDVGLSPVAPIHRGLVYLRESLNGWP